MKIVMPGGSGQVGKVLSRAFQQDGHDVVILSRTPSTSPARTAQWDGATLGPWVQELDGADVVINLAGRSVNCRYGQKNRQLIMESRLASTRVLGEAIAAVATPPAIWLQASTATIYAHRFDSPNDEHTGILGGREANAPHTWQFSIDVATAWEEELDRTQTPRTRKVKMRSAMTMSPDKGGVFAALLNLVRYGLGGKAGDGSQYVSWIHDADFVRSVYWLIEHDEIEGAVNLSSPHPLPNADFMRTLRKAWGISFGLPANRAMLEIGAFLMRTETELILKSRRVVPGILTDYGFQFSYPEWSEAATDLCHRWRALYT